MKTQMRFQKYMCLAMLIMAAITLLYAFVYCSGSLAELGQVINVSSTGEHTSNFDAAEGMNDALLYDDIQGFNTMLMWFGVIMVLLAVTLYITSCNKRRNYYISNVVSIGICAGGCFVLSLVAMIMNAGWRAEFLNIDFEAWLDYSTSRFELFGMEMHYSDSTLWFDLGFVVYILMMIASVMLVLNLVWKIKLMQGEKKLLNGSAQVGGVA